MTLAAVRNQAGSLTIYELPSLRPRDEYRFGSPVATTAFSTDGNELLVVTDDQVAYRLKLTPSTSPHP